MRRLSWRRPSRLLYPCCGRFASPRPRTRSTTIANLPTGTVTFLLTDVEGSTRLWEQNSEAMHHALIRHDALIEAAIERHDGVLVRPRGEGDSRFAVFPRATDAVAAAAAIQRDFHREPWPLPQPLRVRVALHTGEADVRAGDYYGTAVNRCARLRSVAYGGQMLLSQSAEQIVRESVRTIDVPGASLRDLGEHRLKDLLRAERIFELVLPDVPAEFPPLPTLEALPAAPAAGQSPLAHLRARAPLVDRREPMALLRSELEAAATGRGGRVVFLSGEPGVGKTRLAQELRLASREWGATFLEGHYVRDGSAAYAPWVEALRSGLSGLRREQVAEVVEPFGAELAQILPELARELGPVSQVPDLSPGDQRRRLYDGIARVIVALSDRQPVVLLLDDLQWAPGMTVLDLSLIHI